MKNYSVPLALLATACVCPGKIEADTIGLINLSNTGNQGVISVNLGPNETLSPVDVYISQFQMNDSALGGSSSTVNLYTYCVDLFDDENWTNPPSTYTTTRTPITTPFTYGGEMGWLYTTFGGNQSLSGTANAALDEALQIALWDLSLNVTNNPAYMAYNSTGIYFYSSSSSTSPYFSVTNLLNASGASTATIGEEVYDLLNAAQDQSNLSVAVLMNNGGPGDPQQNVLITLPEPSSIVLLGTGLFAGLLWCGRKRLWPASPPGTVPAARPGTGRRVSQSRGPAKPRFRPVVQWFAEVLRELSGIVCASPRPEVRFSFREEGVE
jgi:hypothetical protein